MTLRQKVIFDFIWAVILFVTAAVLALYSLNDINRTTEDIHSKTMELELYDLDTDPDHLDAHPLTDDIDDDGLKDRVETAISGGYVNGQDVLGFTDTANITGSWSAATGVLTLTGTDSVVNYRNALRSVTYVNSEGATPFEGERVISFQVTDGSDSSAAATSTVTVTAVNDAPTITAGATMNYTEADPATVIDGTITIADADSAVIEGATIRVTSGYVISEDLLGFTDTANISSAWDGAGTLTLTGSATLAEYQEALRGVTYENTNALNPTSGSRTISFQVNDGTDTSTPATSTVTVTSVNDLPVVSPDPLRSFTEGDAALAVAPNLTLSDNDSTTMTGATVTIASGYANGEDVLAFSDTANISGSWNASTGTLTLTGTDTVAAYQAALRTVTFDNTVTPPTNPTEGNRSIAFVVDDGTDTSTAGTTLLTVTAVDDAPSATNLNAAESFTEGDAAFSLADIVVSDPDSATVSATLTVSDPAAGALSANNGATYDSATGVWTISDTIANVNTALANVQFTPAANHDTNFTIATAIADTANTISGNKAVTVTAVQDDPTLAANTGLTVDEGGSAVITPAMLEYTDADTGDVLTYTIVTPPANGAIEKNGGALATGDTFTQEDIVNGLVIYRHDGGETTSDSFVFDLDDSESTAGTSPDFNNVTFSITVTPVNDPPASADTTVTTTEDNARTFSSGDFAFSDAETLPGSLQSITITQPPTGGTLRLSGVDVSAGQTISAAAIGNLVYSPAADANGTAYDMFRFKVGDGTDDSQTDYGMTIDVTPVNDAPVLDSSFSPALDVIQRGDSGTAGNSVAEIVADGAISDIDGTAVEAIAVTAVDNGNGTWQYNIGSGWTNFGAVTESGARLLAAGARIRFEPSSGWEGSAAITFRAWDTSSGVNGATADATNNGGTTPFSADTDTASIKVNGPPTAATDAVGTDQNQSVTVAPLANDTDSHNDPLALAGVGQPAHGTVRVNGDGTLTYIPDYEFNGQDSFTYAVSDGSGGIANGTVNITVRESVGSQSLPGGTHVPPVAGAAYVPLETLRDIIINDAVRSPTIDEIIDTAMSEATVLTTARLDAPPTDEYVGAAAEGSAFARNFGRAPDEAVIDMEAAAAARADMRPADNAPAALEKQAGKLAEIEPAAMKTETGRPPAAAGTVETGVRPRPERTPLQKESTGVDTRERRAIPPPASEQEQIRKTLDEAFDLLQCD